MRFKTDVFRNRNGRKVMATFGDRDDGVDFPLGVLPLLREFIELEECRTVLMKHNAKLIPPWSNAQGVLQVTKYSDIHHRGNVVCLRNKSKKRVNFDIDGVRIVSRPDYHDYAMICFENEDCKSLSQAFTQSIAIVTAAMILDKENKNWWLKLDTRLKRKYKEYLNQSVFK